MFFVITLAISGLMLIFLEFFLPGAIMAIGGSLLLLASLFVFNKFFEEGLRWPHTREFFCRWSISRFRLAIGRVRATEKKGTVYLSSDQEGSRLVFSPKKLVGRRGAASTDLKPSGYVRIGTRITKRFPRKATSIKIRRSKF